jgi:hypothetical protein
MDSLQNPPEDAPKERSLEVDLAWLESIRRRIKSPSQRNPDMSWHLNPADQIECQLREDGHRIWGFVIYRTTYDSDVDWAELLRRLASR